jgi:6-phosphogluconolactonase
MSEPSVIVCHDADDLARRAADLFVDTSRAACADRGRCTVALSGGSTPEKTYRLLASPAWAGQVDWGRLLVFFGDERLVPPDDPRSNYGLARRALLGAVPIPEGNVFPIPTDRPAPECVRAYAATLARAFGADPTGPPPSFDLVFLGLGEDGHTASLFPGAAALGAEEWVTSSPPGTLPPPVERVTLTYPTLNASRKVVFLVAGAAKAGVLADVMAGATPQARPAAGARPAGELLWLVDRAAMPLPPASAVR